MKITSPFLNARSAVSIIKNHRGNSSWNAICCALGCYLTDPYQAREGIKEMIDMLKTAISYCFATLLLAAGAGAATPNPNLNVPVNTAKDLGAYTSDAPCNPQTITDYSGFAYDSINHQMLMFGGGHAASARTDVDVFDLKASSPSWKSAYPSTADVGHDGRQS